MSEYIVDTFGIVQDLAELHGDMSTPLYQAIKDVMLSRQHEEIVRCRDCRFCMAYANSTYCDYMAHAIESSGYCAWGEWKDDNERL